MRKLTFLFVILIGLSAGGCSINNENNMQRETTTPALPPVVNKPLVTGWHIGDNPVVSIGDFSFAAHAVVLTGQQTTVLYSLSGPTASTPLANSSIQINDNAKQAYTLSRITTLAQLDRLQVGVITFSPRHEGIRELHVLVRPSAQATPLDMVVARLLNPPEDPSTIAISRQSTSRNGYLEQSGYRISFNGWYLYKGDIVADSQSAKGMTMEEVLRQNATEAASRPVRPGATPTPIQANPSASQLSGGKPILDEATLRIEDLQSHQIRFLYMVFLADGDVKATLLQ